MTQLKQIKVKYKPPKPIPAYLDHLPQWPVKFAKPADKAISKPVTSNESVQPPKLMALTLHDDDTDLYQPQLLQIPEPFLTWLAY